MQHGVRIHTQRMLEQLSSQRLERQRLERYRENIHKVMRKAQLGQWRWHMQRWLRERAVENNFYYFNDSGELFRFESTVYARARPLKSIPNPNQSPTRESFFRSLWHAPTCHSIECFTSLLFAISFAIPISVCCANSMACLVSIQLIAFMHHFALFKSL